MHLNTPATRSAPQMIGATGAITGIFMEARENRPKLRG